MVTDVAPEVGPSAGLTELIRVSRRYTNRTPSCEKSTPPLKLTSTATARSATARALPSSTAGLAHASTVSRRTVAGTTTSPKRHTAARSPAKLSPVR